jgi:GT2 family glycosyltransferase
MSARVSAVLVNLDCGPLLDLVLPSLARQTWPGLDVLVVDNGSSDGSVERIEREFPAVRVLRLGRNTGFSAALNAGIRATRGEYVLSLNFDVVLEPGFVAALVDALERHPEAGWAAGAMRQLSRERAVVDAIDCYGHWMLPSRYVYGCDPARRRPEEYPGECLVFGASACAALYRRRMLEDLALDGQVFDEDLFAYFEDVDLDWRAQQRGWRCIFTPAARGAHMRGGTGLHRRPEVAALPIANRFLVMLKNDEASAVARHLGPIVRRTLRDVALHLRAHPRSLPIALGRLLRFAPRMLAKRRRLRGARRASRAYLASLTLRTRFLG